MTKEKAKLKKIKEVIASLIDGKNRTEEIVIATNLTDEEIRYNERHSKVMDISKTSISLQRCVSSTKRPVRDFDLDSLFATMLLQKEFLDTETTQETFSPEYLGSARANFIPCAPISINLGGHLIGDGMHPIKMNFKGIDCLEVQKKIFERFGNNKSVILLDIDDI